MVLPLLILNSGPNTIVAMVTHALIVRGYDLQLLWKSFGSSYIAIHHERISYPCTKSFCCKASLFIPFCLWFEHTWGFSQMEENKILLFNVAKFQSTYLTTTCEALQSKALKRLTLSVAVCSVVEYLCVWNRFAVSGST